MDVREVYKQACKHFDNYEYNDSYLLFLEASMRLHSDSMFHLSEAYFYGYGTEINYLLSYYWAYRCIKADNNKGYFMLGKCYLSYAYVPRCLAMAKFCFYKCRRFTESKAYLQSSLLKNLKMVEPVVPSYIEKNLKNYDLESDFFTNYSPEIYQDAADDYFDKTDEEGYMNEEDILNAREYLNKAFNMDYYIAMYKVGYLHLNRGQDSNDLFPPVTSLGLPLLLKAGRMGDEESFKLLINIYLNNEELGIDLGNIDPKTKLLQVFKEYNRIFQLDYLKDYVIPEYEDFYYNYLYNKEKTISTNLLKLTTSIEDNKGFDYQACIRGVSMFNPNCSYMLAEHYEEAGMYDNAIYYFNKAIEDSPFGINLEPNFIQNCEDNIKRNEYLQKIEFKRLVNEIEKSIIKK